LKVFHKHLQEEKDKKIVETLRTPNTQKKSNNKCDAHQQQKSKALISKTNLRIKEQHATMLQLHQWMSKNSTHH